MRLQASAQALPILARSSSVMNGAGASSMTFLMAALHGAVALGEVDGVAVFVGNHLDFDVARTLQIAFHVNHRVAESRACFGFGHFDRLEEVFFFSTTRIPRPPPPPEALIMTG